MDSRTPANCWVAEQVGRYVDRVTCICAVAQGGHVVMGGDAALTSGYGDRTIAGPKVFSRSDLLIGASGFLRIGQLLEHAWTDLPAPPEDLDTLPWLIRDFCPAMANFLESIGAGELVTTSGDDDESWTLLIGARGRIYRLCSHLEVTEPQLEYAATGSGAPFALGSLASTGDMDPMDRVKLALSAAAQHASGVSPPFTILTSAHPAGGRSTG